MCSYPAVIAATLVNTTADGVFRFAFEPSPSYTHHDHRVTCSDKQQACTALTWPDQFAPQHLTPPDVVSAHVEKDPAVIAATLVNTSADGVFRSVFVPSPSCTDKNLIVRFPCAIASNMRSTCLAIAITTPASHTA